MIIVEYDCYSHSLVVAIFKDGIVVDAIKLHALPVGESDKEGSPEPIDTPPGTKPSPATPEVVRFK